MYLLAERLLGEQFVVEAYLVSIHLKRMARSVNGNQGKSTIVMHFLNLIRVEPSCLQIAWETLESGIIKQIPIPFLEHFLLDKVVMPFYPLFLNNFSLSQSK